MILYKATVEVLSFIFAVCVSHTQNVFVPDIIINISSSDHLLIAVLCVGSRLFELFSKKGTCIETPRNVFKKSIENFNIVWQIEIYMQTKFFEPRNSRNIMMVILMDPRFAHALWIRRHVQSFVVCAQMAWIP